MAEKGDAGQDTVSLPPTYAPSEAYTESPPPAYRGGRNASSKTVQIVKLLCVTAVVLALLIGFFVLSTNYLKTRACTCDPRPLDTEESRAALLQAGLLSPLLPPSAQALVKEEKPIEKKEEAMEEEEMTGNTLDAGDEPVLGDETMLQVEEERQLDAALDEMEKEVLLEKEEEEEAVRREEEQEEALQDILNAQAEHMKKIRLPIELILGNNPALAGREVSCEVERRQVPLAPGVTSQTIFVTCRDADEDEEEKNDLKGGPAPFPLPPRPLRPRQGPPMSLLAPIMKMLTSRPGPQPRLVPISLRGPVPLISQPRPSLQQVTLRQNPFPLPISKPRMVPVSVRGPVSMIVPRPVSQDAPSDRMLPRNLQPVVRVAPRFISLPRADQSPPSPISLLGLQRGALPIPQARARAPPSPVSLSSSPFPQRRLPPAFVPPFNAISEPQSRPASRPEPRPATHMELIAPRGGPQDPTPPRMDFGPPRGHTLINGPPQDSPQAPPRSPPRLVTLPKAIRIHTLPRGSLTPPGPQSHPQVPPKDFPPPPHMAPEPLRSPVPPEVNLEAEVVASPQPPQAPQPQGDGAPSTAPHRKHHLLMVN